MDVSIDMAQTQTPEQTVDQQTVMKDVWQLIRKDVANVLATELDEEIANECTEAFSYCRTAITGLWMDWDGDGPGKNDQFVMDVRCGDYDWLEETLCHNEEDDEEGEKDEEGRGRKLGDIYVNVNAIDVAVEYILDYYNLPLTEDELLYAMYKVAQEDANLVAHMVAYTAVTPILSWANDHEKLGEADEYVRQFAGKVVEMGLYNYPELREYADGMEPEEGIFVRLTANGLDDVFRKITPQFANVYRYARPDSGECWIYFHDTIRICKDESEDNRYGRFTYKVTVEHDGHTYSYYIDPLDFTKVIVETFSYIFDVGYVEMSRALRRFIDENPRYVVPMVEYAIAKRWRDLKLTPSEEVIKYIDKFEEFLDKYIGVEEDVEEDQQ
ncbi:MAG: hypothetical protein ACK4SY_07775 [Pyrobaculum sp.]